LPAEARVGSVLRNCGLESVAVAEVNKRLDGCGEEDLTVEEQDHSWYIAHLGTDPKGWIAIKEDSLLYEGFRRYHAEWRGKSSKGQ
jgi:hypothetical protein